MTAHVFPLPRTVIADLVPGARTRDIALMIVGAGLTGLAAQVAINTPLTPVPFTLQTLAVLVVGASLGPVRGLISMLIYLAAGSAGVPWFAKGTSGWAHSPSFGYILGFVVAASIVGFLAKRGADRHVLSTIALMVLGTAVIYAFGATWLAVDLHLTLRQTWTLGIQPFLVSDALKIGVASAVFPMTWAIVRRP